MWIRTEVKARGAFSFKRNYWCAVAVSVILLIVTGGLSSPKGGNSYTEFRRMMNTNGSMLNTFNYDWDVISSDGIGAYVASAVMSSVLAVGAIAGTLFVIFVGNIIDVGSRRFFMESRERKSGVDTILYGFRSRRYGNVALTMFLRDLFTLLWSFLFIVPGIVKSYEYRMIPYILAENPNMSYKDAFEMSKWMMNGQKWETFILDLSFIGWWILSSITCSIVGIFYVNPYYNASNAELYAVLRDHAFYTGRYNTSDLPGFGM